MNRKDVITPPVNRILVALVFKTPRVAGRCSRCSLRRTARVLVVATFSASFLNHACAAPGLRFTYDKGLSGELMFAEARQRIDPIDRRGSTAFERAFGFFNDQTRVLFSLTQSY